MRNWLGAYSGWAAALGALLAAAWTAPLLERQIGEARRQSDFLVGDADPEFVLLRNSATRGVSIKVINWNRRRIVVEMIEAVDAHTLRFADNVDAKRRRIDGWVNRSGAPEEKTINLVINDGAPISDKEEVTAKVTYRVIGQTHERRETATTTLIDE